MLRKKADRIRGVAGSLGRRRVLVADAAVGAGPGIIRVIADAGSEVLASASNGAMLDVAIARLDSPPHPIVPVASPEALATSLPPRIDDLVVNPTCTEVAAAAPWVEIVTVVGDAMRDRGHTGNIVFVISGELTGSLGSIGAFFRSEVERLAARLAPNGIRVNVVAVGPVGTTRRGQPRHHQATPLGHVTIHPVDVGKAVWFLLNAELSGAITGAIIRVDRGAALSSREW